MELTTVVTHLVDIHRDYQEAGGFSDSGSVSSRSCPLTELQGFDSDFIPEIVRRLARTLGHPLPEGVRVKNIYVSQDRQQKLTIEEVAKRFVATYLSAESKV
jgi:hypothetical protein